MRKSEKSLGKMTISALARELGVSRNTVMEWRSDGAPVEKGTEAVTAWAMENQKKGNDSQDIRSAKLRVLEETARRLKMANDLKDKSVIPRDSVTTAIQKGMAILFAMLDRFSDQMPSVLHGADANSIKAKLVAANEGLKSELRIKFEEAL